MLPAKLRLPVDMLAQPDEVTCGPTCLHAIYRYWGNGDQYGISHDGTWDVKKVWGTVPVYEDGSALFSVPANTGSP